MIEIRGELELTDEESIDESPTDRAERFLYQVAADATYGTFADFYDYYQGDWEIEPDELSYVENYEQIESSTVEDNEQREFSVYKYRFRIKLTTDIIDVERGGLQHLIGILAGDTFRLYDDKVGDYKCSIDEVNLDEETKRIAVESFRTENANEISNIREQFDLEEKMPFLAYSFKPRVGLQFEQVREITKGVLKEGFHLVELDTRNLNLSDERVGQLLELANEVQNIDTSHTTRFAPNLTVPPDMAVDLYRRFIEYQDDPVVLKVDGGLDGISTCQAIRKIYSEEYEAERDPPIITCYPLLRYSITDKYVPEDFLVDTLARSGADIIYPGGRPNLEAAPRGFDQEEANRLRNALDRYDGFTNRGWPMPTIAGGIYAGQLHTFYELLGPSVSYFIGGGIAVHKEGPQEGARLCADIIETLAEEHRDEPNRTAPLRQNIEDRINKAYASDELDYKVPGEYIDPEDVLDARGVRPFYDR